MPYSTSYIALLLNPDTRSAVLLGSARLAGEAGQWLEGGPLGGP